MHSLFSFIPTPRFPLISFLSRSFLLVGVASLRIDRDSAVVDHRALQVLGGSTTPRETMRRVLLVRTAMELAACGMFNLHHSFNIDAAELRDAPSLTWPEPTTATATPLGASIGKKTWTHRGHIVDHRLFTSSRNASPLGLSPLRPPSVAHSSPPLFLSHPCVPRLLFFSHEPPRPTQPTQPPLRASRRRRSGGS